MPTIDIKVAASADDAHQLSDGTTDVTAIAVNNIDAVDEWIAARFLDVTIPDDATIDVAYLQVGISVAAQDEPDHTLYGENADAPAAFSAGGAGTNNISGRTRTTATGTFSSTNLGATTTPTYFNTGSLVSVIEELMAARSYAAGRDLVIMMHGSADGARDLGVIFWDGNPDFAPNLHIEYTAAGGAVAYRPPSRTLMGLGR